MYDNELFKKFCKERNIKKSTIGGYSIALKQYADFQDESIEYLIKEAYCDEKNKIPLKDRKLKQRLLNFRDFLINSELSPTTAKTYFSNVKTFYMHFEIEIPYLPTIQYDKDYETSYFDLPTKEQINLAINLVGIRVGSRILFMVSSGTG